MKRSLLPVRRPPPSKEELEAILRRHFGYQHFRGKQLEAIQSVLSGTDCFCLMPTGGGKSLCYQIPALAKVGIVLVVSPLIALMENQVATLKERAIRAEFLSSAQTAQTKEKIYEDLDSGKPSLRLLYVTPELVATSGFKAKLAKLHARGLLNLVAIDEAHCISSWGHDFRPSYRKLESLRSQLQGVPLLALTATAAPEVRTDVIESLRLQNPVVLVTSFNRPNIFYEVRYKELLGDVYLDVFNLIKTRPHDCTIIYCHERSVCDDLSAYLVNNGVTSAAYHAGLNNKTRSAVLQNWVSSRLQVVVATVAFGMGIDRKDVRLVCHFNIPKSMEAFYQESGRCGRDQLPSRSVLYFGLDDRRKMEFIISNDKNNAGRPQSSSAGSSRNPLANFTQIVKYCEGTGCRRKKILECFGEQMPISVCQKTCDTCKYPNKVAACIEQLGCLQRTGFTPVIFKSSSAMDQDAQETEFWNREDDADSLDIDEDISDSDDGGPSINAFTRIRASSPSMVNRKIDWLQQAEERYYKKKDPSKKASVPSKNTISDAQRNAIKQRLLDALKQNLNHSNMLTDVETAASLLESECFKKYGKVGKSFYNSEAASTVRWISSSGPSEINDRLRPISAPLTTTSKYDKEAASSTFPVSSKEIPRTANRNNSSDELLVKCKKEESAAEVIQTVNGNDSSQLLVPLKKEESAPPIDVPLIPSFAEFANKKSLAVKSTTSSCLSKRSTADILKGMVPKEDAGKRVRLI